MPTTHARSLLARRSFLCRAAACTGLLLPVGAGCRRPEDRLKVQVELQAMPQPPEVGAAFWRARIRDSAGRAVSGAVVEIEATMTHPGMTPVLRGAREAAPGTYEAEGEWTMAGDWVVTVRGELPNGTRFESTVPVSGVRPPRQ